MAIKVVAENDDVRLELKDYFNSLFSFLRGNVT